MPKTMQSLHNFCIYILVDLHTGSLNLISVSSCTLIAYSQSPLLLPSIEAKKEKESRENCDLTKIDLTYQEIVYFAMLVR